MARVHPCALDGSHSAYVRAVLRAVGVEPNIRTVYTALTRNLRSQENARGDLAIDQLMASLDTQDARPRARGDQRKMVREVVQRYARGDSGAVVWAPTGFGKTVILRDLVRLLGGSFARTIVLTTVQLVEQTKTAVGRTAENVHILTYSKKPGEQLEDAEHFDGTTLVLADECSRLPSTWKDWIKRRGAFRLLFTATPIRSYLEDMIDLAELVMEFPDDGDTKGAALTSLDLVVHGLGFGNQKGKEEEAAIASADFRDFVERFVVRAKREDIRALLKRSMGENGIASFRTLLHVGDKIEKIQEDAKKLNPDLLKKQRTNASYISAIAELAPNAAMARLGPEICNELDLHGLLVSPLEEELFRILEGRISEGHTSLVVIPSHVGAACPYLHSYIGIRLRDFSSIGYIDRTVSMDARAELLSRLKSGDLKVLFATTGIVGYGYNLSKVSTTIIMTSPWTGEELIQTIGRAIRIAETVPQEEGVDREKQLVIINGFSKVASRSMGRDGRAVMRVGMHKALLDDPVVEAAFGDPALQAERLCRLLESGTRPDVL